MPDDLDVRVKTTLEADVAKSAQAINSQLPSISNQIKSKIKVQVEADAASTADNIQKSVKAATSSLKTGKVVVPVNVDYQINSKDDYLRRALVQDFKRFQAQAKDLKIDTSAYQNAFNTGSLKDASKELGILFKTLHAISAEDVSKLPSLSITNFSKNVKEAASNMDTLQARVKALSVGNTSGLTSSITKIKSELQELAKIEPGNVTNLDVEKFNTVKSEIDSVVNSLKTFKAEQASFKIDIGAEKLSTDIERAKQGLQNMRVVWSKAFTKPEYQTQWDSLWNTINSGAIKTRAQLSAFNAEVNLMGKQIEGAGLASKTFLGQLGDSIKKFSSWFFIGGGVATTVRAVKGLFDNVIELNKAYTDLKIVTNGTDQATSELLDSYNKLGQRIGATTTEVASAASDWLRQGKSIADTSTLIQDSMILSKVGNINSADATTYLTSAMKGYNVEASKAIGIVDKLTSVDLISATSAAGLASGMSEVANNANLAGVSMDKLLGYLAAVGRTLPTLKWLKTVKPQRWAIPWVRLYN